VVIGDCLSRLLRRNQVRRIRDALKAHGFRLVVLARSAIFPTGLLAATAGASGMKSARYFPADGLAFAAAAGLVVGAGYGLGLAQRESDLWLTVIGTTGADRAVGPAEVVCPARAGTVLLADPG
jgi:membrane protein DedA with SNARE-associated domain